MGTPIDGAVGRDFGITRGGGARGNLAADNGGGRVETVLSEVKRAEHDMDWKALFARRAITPLENFLWKCDMGYTLYPWISLLESTLVTSYKPQT